MQVINTAIPDLLLIKPDVFGDARGFFQETFQARRYKELGIDADFVQDNVSFSQKGVLRGLHYQDPQPQGKLVYVLQGEVYDVAVDIRPGSATYGQWVGEYLSSENHHQFWVPPGFAHGFCVTSETALFAYKCSNYYDPATEHCIRWNDPDLDIRWPIKEPLVSNKDKNGALLKDTVV
jgi:dTDP-4-dehydrorhamnose 3,5-epimerase